MLSHPVLLKIVVGVNKDSYLILENLPQEYDSRVKAMQCDERPSEQYNDIGGLDKQIQELIEAVVLPMTHKEKFENLGIQVSCKINLKINHKYLLIFYFFIF